MRVVGRVVAWISAMVVGAGLSLACGGPPLFLCSSGDECEEGGEPGTCQPGGLCSFPDDDCTTGQRYGNHAGNASGECVPNVNDTEGTTTATSEASSTAPVTSGMSSVDGASTNALDSGDSTSSSIATSDSGGTSGSTGGDSSTGDPNTTGTTTGDDPYGPCQDAADCPMGIACLPIGDNGLSACVPECAVGGMGVGMCPPHPDGFSVECYTDLMVGLCLMSCNPMMPACPNGFSCFTDPMMPGFAACLPG